MAWTAISNALVAVGAKPFATTIQALRDNFAAMAGGETGAPRVAGQALNLMLAAVNATTTTPTGWTDLDRADWLELDVSTTTGGAGTVPNLQARLSSDNGATWSAYGTLRTGTQPLTTQESARVYINIKTGAFLYFGPLTTDRFNSGTLALTGSPNALQLRQSQNGGAQLNMVAKIIGGIA